MILDIGRARSKFLPRALAIAWGAAVAAPAAAVELPLGDDWSGAFDTTLSVGIGVRASSPDCRFIGQDSGGCASTDPTPIARTNGDFSQSYDGARLNQDYGTRNFKKGEVYSARVGGVSELFLKNRPADFSGLVRFSYQYDPRAGKSVRFGEQNAAARNFATRDVTLLDAYVSKMVSVADQDVRVRIGNQALSWGENLFTPGGVNATNAIDVRKSHQPGVQLKEIGLPAPMLNVSAGLGAGFSLEAYYQAMWNAYEFDAPGAFFSTNNALGRGPSALYVASSALGLPPGSVTNGNSSQSNVIPHGSDRRVSSQGQFGVALRRQDESGNELGLYYYRYHDKIPFLSFIADPTTTRNPLGLGGYQREYGEYRSLYGASYNMRLGEWMVGLEGSYRPRDAVSIDPTIVVNPNNPYACVGREAGYRCRGAVDTEKWQFHATGNHIMSPSGSLGWLMTGLGADEGTILAEAVLAATPRLKGGVPYAVTPDYRSPTKTSTGAVAQVSLTYSNAFGTRVSLIPELTVSQGISGVSATPAPGFVKGAGAVNLGLTVDLKTATSSKIRGDFTYYYGGGTANPMLDRKNAQITYVMSF